MPIWCGLSFQDSSSPFLSHLCFLHDHVMMFMIFVVFFILYILVYMMLEHKFYKYFSEGTFIETIWSMVPAFFLIFLMVPSMRILYMMEDIKSPLFSFKVLGHQWYWSYVSPLLNNFFYSVGKNVYYFYEFDMLLESDSMYPRLLGCSESLLLPNGKTSRLLITSTDVIHSFAVPSMGLKVDAVPGRVNQIFSLPSRCGVFFGQCSEICGSNHSFMPITLEVCNDSNFILSSTSILVEEVLSLDKISF